MKKINQSAKTLSLIFLLSVVLSLPNFTFAATLITIVNSLLSTISYIAGVVTVICWVITGLLFITAQGDPTKLNTARKALIFATVGTAISLLAGTAPSLIGTAVGLP